MTEKVLSTKVTNKDVEIIKTLAEVNGITVSALLRELLEAEIKNKNISWEASCFGSNPRNDKPKYKNASIDEVVYRKKAIWLKNIIHRFSLTQVLGWR